MFSAARQQGNDCGNAKRRSEHVEQGRPRYARKMKQQHHDGKPEPCNRQQVPYESKRLPGESIVTKESGKWLTEKPYQDVLFAKEGMCETYGKS